MNENRETSETPAGNYSRTAGEGLGRKACMNVHEESDIGRFRREGSTSRRPTDGSVRSGSPHWRTR